MQNLLQNNYEKILLLTPVFFRGDYRIATVDDETLYYWAEKIYCDAGLKLEPSAAAGFAALSTHASSLVRDGETKTTRVLWTTGGAMLPDLEFEAILSRARAKAAH